MKPVLRSLISCVLVAGSLAADGVSASQDHLPLHEQLFLKRMVEFWKDRDYSLVKQQIETFLASHPDATIHNNLYALLGDILYQEENYPAALEAYKKVEHATLRERIGLRQLQCLYLTEQYDDVLREGEILLHQPMSQNETQEVHLILGDTMARHLSSLANPAQQKAMASKAQQLLLPLAQTSHRTRALAPLAITYRVLNQPMEASQLYETLAEQEQARSDAWLLQSGMLQLEFDPTRALDTFHGIVERDGEQRSDAAYQELCLLFQQQNFATLLERAPRLRQALRPEHHPFLDFYLGSAYVALHRFAEAIPCFQGFLEQAPQDTTHQKTAFASVLRCAHELNNDALFAHTLNSFSEQFPHDIEVAHGLVLRAQMSFKQEKYAQALEDLDRVMTQFPDFPEQEHLIYDRAILMTKTEQWERARSELLTYVHRFPTSSHMEEAWSTIVQCSMQELQIASPQTANTKKMQLVDDLGEVLSLSQGLNPNEEASYRLIRGQLQFDLKHYADALHELEQLCQAHPEHPSVPEAYLLQTIAHHELKDPPERLIETGEKGLAHLQDPAQTSLLRLHLFNAYTSLKEYAKAAEMLYHVFMVDHAPIQRDNQSWLIDYYLTAAGTDGAQDKALNILKRVVPVDASYSITTSQIDPALEKNALQLASLLPPTDRKNLLESLVGLAQDSSEEVVFELGKTHLSLGDDTAALSCFETILASQKTVASASYKGCLLERARLQLKQLPPEDKNEYDTRFQSILTTLKDLQIQKEISSEPLHLEAAVEYISLRIGLAKPALRAETALFFLNRMREDFLAQDTPVNQAYHECRLASPKKNQIFQLYMQFLEADTLYWESQQAILDKNGAKEQESRTAALMMLEHLMHDPHLTPLLKERIQERVALLTS